MNPLPHGRHADVEAQVIELLGPLARAAGLKRLDASNVGDANDYRGPDGLLVRPGPHRLYYPTAALVLEVVSPGDETWDKLAFYAAHGVEELLIVDTQERAVHWRALAGTRKGAGGEYRPIQRSGLLDLGSSELAERIDWPRLDDD
jgi:Uma2 family endonuclease